MNLKRVSQNPIVLGKDFTIRCFVYIDRSFNNRQRYASKFSYQRSKNYSGFAMKTSLFVALLPWIVRSSIIGKVVHATYGCQRCMIQNLHY
jgi:hypothetical protein